MKRMHNTLRHGFLFACLSAAASAAMATDIQGATWLLQELAGKPVSGIHLRLADGRASGNDGCNLLMGQYSGGTEGSLRFQVDSMASTMMACLPERSATASSYQAALAQTQGYQLQAQTLTLTDAKGKALAVYALQNDGLEGTQWQITGLNNGRQAVVSKASIAQLQLRFLADGQLQATASCGTSYGVYSFDTESHGLEIPNICIRGKACPKFDPARAELAQLHQALQSSTSYRRTGERLELRSEDGALQISATVLP